MNTNDQKRLYELIEARYGMRNMKLTKAIFEVWLDDLAGHAIDNIVPAFKQAASTSNFLVQPSNVLELLPDLSGHVSREIAWSLCPKTPFDGAYITDEIMQARGTCEDAIEGGDKMARMAFLEAYDQILANARVQNKVAHWWYTSPDGGTSKQRQEQKLQKTLEAATCGRLTQQRAVNAVNLICAELGRGSTQYLSKLPSATNLPTLPQSNGLKRIGNQ